MQSTVCLVINVFIIINVFGERSVRETINSIYRKTGDTTRKRRRRRPPPQFLLSIEMDSELITTTTTTTPLKKCANPPFSTIWLFGESLRAGALLRVVFKLRDKGFCKSKDYPSLIADDVESPYQISECAFKPENVLNQFEK